VNIIISLDDLGEKNVTLNWVVSAFDLQKTATNLQVRIAGTLLMEEILHQIVCLIILTVFFLHPWW